MRESHAQCVRVGMSVGVICSVLGLCYAQSLSDDSHVHARNC